MNVAIVPCERQYLNSTGVKYFEYIFWLREVREVISERGVSLKSISDYDDLGDVDCFLFLNGSCESGRIYVKLLKRHLENKCIYWMAEPDVVLPWHDNKKIHTLKHLFPLIATDKEDIVDYECFFPLHSTQIYNDEHLKWRSCGRIEMSFAERKLMTNISGNKSSRHPNELYSERRRIIRWFEREHRDEFDLYGRGWTSDYISYKGTVKDKSETYSKYRFSLCFENVTNERGLISEKIFDCFRGGVVPIYYGVPEIRKIIPFACYICFDDFESIYELYDFIHKMTEDEWQEYGKEAERFLQSDWSKRFRSEQIAEEMFSVCEKITKHKDFRVAFFTKLVLWIRMKPLSLMRRFYKRIIANLLQSCKRKQR